MIEDKIFDALCVIGAVAIASVTVGLLALFSAIVWIEASRKWRGIIKAERLIIEYKRNREEFLKWKKEKEEEE